MNNLSVVQINNQDVNIKEYNNTRVVTFEDIDMLHRRPEGISYRNFCNHKKHFVEGIDYFNFKGNNGRKALAQANLVNFTKLNNSPNFSFYLITESGYLMLVKSLQDDLAWEVQRQLVNVYFKAKQIQQPQYNLPTTYKEALIQLLTVVEEKEKIEEQNKVLLPKAEGYDDFLSAKNAQTMNECAKVLKIGRNKLFRFLRQNDILMSDNLPYQRFCDSEYFTVREIHFIRGNYEYNGCQCLVTAKGLEFMLKLLKEKGFCVNSLALSKNNIAI